MTRGPCSGVEPLVADRVEAVMPAEGIEPGSRECHDAQKDHLRIDFVYSQARPRSIALEVTGIWDGWHRSGVTVADRLTLRLSTIAEAEELGAWLVAVRTDARLKELEPEIANVIRDAQPNRVRMLEENDQIRPGHYTDADLRRLPSRRAERRFIDAHDRLKAMGLEEIKPVHAEREHVVAVLPTTGVRSIGSFAEFLKAAVEDNAAKLGEAPDHERHLAVYVERFDASRDPNATRPPAFPAEIDVIWVVHRYLDGYGRSTVWIARRGETDWRVYTFAAAA